MNGEIGTAQLTRSVVLERIPANEMNVANSSAGELTSDSMREFTPEKNPLPVIRVEMPPVTTCPFNSMSESTLQRNYMNVIYVVTSLANPLTSAIMRTHAGEKPYTCNEYRRTFSLSVNLYTRVPTGETPYSLQPKLKS